MKTFIHTLLAAMFIAGALLPSGCGSLNPYYRMDKEARSFLDDVRYIITEDEKRRYYDTPVEQRAAFEERFWKLRDPNPNTVINEFKAEHFRRIAVANRMFTSGKPGWLTDRGKTYILFGPPDEVVQNPGGAASNEYPTIIWTYHRINQRKLGPGYEVVFVDHLGTGDFSLATNIDAAKVPTPGSSTVATGSLLGAGGNQTQASGGAPEFDRSLQELQNKALVQTVDEDEVSENMLLEPEVESEIQFSLLPFRQKMIVSDVPEGLRITLQVAVAYRDLFFNNPEKGLQEGAITIRLRFLDIGNEVIESHDDDQKVTMTDEELLANQNNFFSYSSSYLLPIGCEIVVLQLVDRVSGNSAKVEIPIDDLD